MRSTIKKAVRIGAAWAVLAAVLACGSSNEDDTPPAPTVQPAPPPPVAPPPIAPPPPSDQPQPTVVVQLSTGFLPDPYTGRGQAGGTVPAAIFTSRDPNCRGFLPATPQYTMTLQTSFRDLRVMSHAAQDTTIVIRGPDGTHYCADDDEGLNPIVSRAFAPGTYQVYIGTYQGGVRAPYVLGISELPSVTPATLGY